MQAKPEHYTLNTEKIDAFTRHKPDSTAADHATVEENIRYLEWLITWYCQRPSCFIANIIVTRLEALRTQESLDVSSLSQWSCQRLVRNWQYIADRQRVRS